MRAEATILTLKCDKPHCITTQTWTGDPNACVDKALDAGWGIGERIMDEPRDLCPLHAKQLAEWIGADTSAWDGIRAANPTAWDTDPLPVTETINPAREEDLEALEQKSCCCFAEGINDDNCCDPCHSGKHSHCVGPLAKSAPYESNTLHESGVIGVGMDLTEGGTR